MSCSFLGFLHANALIACILHFDGQQGPTVLNGLESMFKLGSNTCMCCRDCNQYMCAKGSWSCDKEPLPDGIIIKVQSDADSSAHSRSCFAAGYLLFHMLYPPPCSAHYKGVAAQAGQQQQLVQETHNREEPYKCVQKLCKQPVAPQLHVLLI